MFFVVFPVSSQGFGSVEPCFTVERVVLRELFALPWFYLGLKYLFVDFSIIISCCFEDFFQVGRDYTGSI